MKPNFDGASYCEEDDVIQLWARPSYIKKYHLHEVPSTWHAVPVIHQLLRQHKKCCNKIQQMLFEHSNAIESTESIDQKLKMDTTKLVIPIYNN